MSVNDGPEILFVNTPTVNVDGLSGDDVITVRAPAPNGLPWNVTANLTGGPPSAVSGHGGDTLVVETPASVPAPQTATYTPATSDTGSLVIQPVNATINILSTAIPGQGNPIVGGNGGIETLIYDGEGGNDLLVVQGDGAGAGTNDRFVHTPGAAIDAGAVAVNSLLAIAYQNLGATGTVTLDGQAGTNTLVARGYNSNDAFTVAATTGTVDLVSYLGNHVDLIRANLQTLTLDGLDGDDTFTLNAPLPYATVNVWGGNPAAGSDAVTYNGTVGTDTLALTLAAAGDVLLDTTVALAPVTTNLINVEDLTVASAGGVDTLSVTEFGTATDLQNVIFNAGGDATDTFAVTGTRGSRRDRGHARIGHAGDRPGQRRQSAADGDQPGRGRHQHLHGVRRRGHGHRDRAWHGG